MKHCAKGVGVRRFSVMMPVGRGIPANSTSKILSATPLATQAIETGSIARKRYERLVLRIWRETYAFAFLMVDQLPERQVRFDIFDVFGPHSRVDTVFGYEGEGKSAHRDR